MTRSRRRTCSLFSTTRTAGQILLLSLCVASILIGWQTAAYGAAKAVSFPLYLPVDPEVYGHRVFRYTLGNTGEFTSEIVGAVTVPYQSGTVTGVKVTGIEPGVTSVGWANDGAYGRLFISADSAGGTSYLSSDCQLTSPPQPFAFSGLADGMLANGGSMFLVPADLSSCMEVDPYQRILISIQDIEVTEGFYENAVIMWQLDLSKPYTQLNFNGQQARLGIQFPTSEQTEGKSITNFSAFGVGAGLIARGNIDAASGVLQELFELISVTHDPLPLPPAELPVVASFSQLAIGGGYESVVLLSNKTNLPWDGIVTLKQGNGADWASAWSLDGVSKAGQAGFDVSLPARGTQKFVLDGDNLARAGYLLVQGKTGYEDAITGSLYYRYVSQGQLIDSLGVPASSAGHRFWFMVERTPTSNTGFAYAATQPSDPFNVTVSLFNAAGTLVQEKTLSYEGHVARFFAGPDGVFDSVPDGFVGAVLVTSPQDLTLTVLRLDITAYGLQLTVVPPASEGVRAF
jgi:hypothetical protein